MPRIPSPSAPAARLSDTELPLDERRINDLGQGLGQAVGAVAEIVITTPLKVLTVVTGQ